LLVFAAAAAAADSFDLSTPFFARAVGAAIFFFVIFGAFMQVCSVLFERLVVVGKDAFPFIPSRLFMLFLCLL
jgi:hypothetical protein